MRVSVIIFCFYMDCQFLKRILTLIIFLPEVFLSEESSQLYYFILIKSAALTEHIQIYTHFSESLGGDLKDYAP